MVRTRLNIGCRYSTPVRERPLHPTRGHFTPEPSQTQAPVTPATEPERRAGGGLTTNRVSGSGKSTLIRHFNRLIEPTSGRIEVDGVDVLRMNRDALRAFRRGKVSMVFQRFALLPHKTVLENIIYGLVIGGQSKDKARRHGLEQIELVGLEGFEDHYPSQLSGGMQQRVGLARAGD